MPLRTQDFFLNVKDILRKPESTSVSAHNYRQAEKDLQDKYANYYFFCFTASIFSCLYCPYVEFPNMRHGSQIYRGFHTVLGIVVVAVCINVLSIIYHNCCQKNHTSVV